MDLLFLPFQQIDPYGFQQTLGVGGRAAGAFLGTLIVGALVLAFADEGVIEEFSWFAESALTN